MADRQLELLVARALEEDLGSGDHTSLACIDSDISGSARLIVKERGILAGLRSAHEVFRQTDARLKMDCLLADGSGIEAGDIAFILSGPRRSILRAERVALNLLQRMSGIATTTSKYVEAVKGYDVKILDTRKTTPGMRFLEKEAVRLGGGENHRMGLWDMIMIKDNHIDFAGGIVEAIGRTHDYLRRKGLDLKIEIEARSIEDVEKIVLTGGVDRIMFDNFTPSVTAIAVKIVNRQFETESSGGITMDNIREYAACGVGYISVGALTHHIKSLDMSLKAT
ncbi:MAG: carboxylating nicotinate-nucleotide diphosphorylase [Bacteroidales bacterium]|jgi:nicotinate-nucleotide pyrophosphorylase (carboxylating)|nr:carboxylating nicotinate-nucleotide diphosphorylase [Bacteroidales bacterium]